MRRRQLKRLWARLKQLSTMQLTREELLMKLGAARDQSRIAWRLAVIEVAADSATFSYGSIAISCGKPDRAKADICYAPTSSRRTRPSCGATTSCWSRSRRRSRTSKACPCESRGRPGDPADLSPDRGAMEAHIFIAFLAYCLHVTLARRLRALAPGLTPRSVIEKFAAVQMIDVHLPTTDGRELLLTRYTEPQLELSLLLKKLKLELPAQPSPKITARALAPSTPV